MTTLAMTTHPGMTLLVSDVSGQKQRTVTGPPRDASVGDLIQELLPQMQLPQADAHGRPLNYSARLEREGRLLHGSEIIGEALQSDDRLVLQPNIDAGQGL